MRLYADYQVQRGNAAYLYFFAQNPPAPAGEPPFPAAHAAEVPYVFNNVGELPLFPDRSDPKLAAASAPDLKVADQMSSYWVNFARTGNPNGPGLPVWQAHTVKAGDKAIIFDADPAAEQLPSPARLAVLDKLWERQQHAAH
jgi:para-nitrobenzyl esterase